MNDPIRSLKTATQLGLDSSLHYLIYQLGLKSGHYRCATPVELFLTLPAFTVENVQWWIHLPSANQIKPVIADGASDLEQEANEILNDQLRYFGGQAEPFRFEEKDDTLIHWSEAESAHTKQNTIDIKYIWEPARFNWVFPLARAYVIFDKEIYAQKFWELFNRFTRANPFNSGLNWCSAQEVSLRMMALIFGGSVFKTSKDSTPQNLALLFASIFLHAKRIPPTLVYARAQKNNHLITEAVGLYCAGSFFKNLPIARTWKAIGWKYFNQAIQQQISENGEYIQHSLNYHRLMLQVSLWMDRIVRQNEEVLPVQSFNKLRLAAEWLLNYIEPTDGHTPNLGHNDGSNIFPLSQCKFADYRPVAQAAAIAFLGKPVMESGYWNEELLWLDIKNSSENIQKFETQHLNQVPWIGNSKFRVYLQTEQFRSRPAHADQLHADIWFKGFNLAMDAGTYSYNLAFPWQNALAGTAVHNTITIDGLDQMTPTGKFLWLDWSNANIIEFSPKKNFVQAKQDGYQRFGITHKRRILLNERQSGIKVEDGLDINQSPKKLHTACLHWLLPDWKWELDQYTLKLNAPFGRVNISITNDKNSEPIIDLIREGKSLLLNKSGNPTLGWYSPTYLSKTPALSLRYSINFDSSFKITTTWQIMDINAN